MPEPASIDRNEYLQRVADRLPFDRAEKLDVLREIAGHLDDSTALLVANGLTPNAAEQAAIDRLGGPEDLADGLTEARRSPRRLLAAAGAGTYAALGGVVYGYLFGLLALALVALGAAALAAGPLRFLGASWNALPDVTSTTVASIGVGAFVAGRKVTVTVAARAGYPITRVRTVTAASGGLIVAAYALNGWRGALTWPEVALVLSLPVWFVAGAATTTQHAFPSRRWRLGVVAMALLAVPVALVFGLGQGFNGSGSGVRDLAGVERIGLPAPAAIESTRASGESGSRQGSAVDIVTFGGAGLFSAWHDFRIEAWSGTVDADFSKPPAGSLDPRAAGPFAVARAELLRDGDSWTLRGSVEIDRAPSVAVAWVAMTGVGPDGQRYILHGPGYVTTSFDGTVLDWFAAVAAGR
jgi:hypothetical protein